MADSGTGRPPPVRIGTLRGFLPLSDELVSTRGQVLPSLIQNRSSASLKDVRASGSFGPSRKHGNYSYESEEEMDLERDVDASIRESRLGNRRMSNGSQALNTPQMRSMRLIGNSNPRYQW